MDDDVQKLLNIPKQKQYGFGTGNAKYRKQLVLKPKTIKMNISNGNDVRSVLGRYDTSSVKDANPYI
ncbi:hypothetical protein HanIR_Chr01g0040751 [Helianthus annuus]|nr:hypothetical protein HanIR_Chr01g0040751 [Helianthus annuus]